MKTHGPRPSSMKKNGHDPSGSNGHSVLVKSNGHGPAPAMTPGSSRLPVKAPAPARAPVRGITNLRVPMKSVSEEAFRVLASTVARLVDQGKRSILITSSGPGEGKSTVTAALARRLAKSGRLGVVVVDADTIRPRQHELFQMENRRGLGELLRDVYHVDLSRENPDQFGVGDWIELIRAQSRTGKLEIAEGSEEFSVHFSKGKVSSLVAHPGEAGSRLGEMLVAQGRISEEQRASALRVQEEGSHPFGEVLQGLGYLRAGDLDQVLQSQFKSRLHRILTMRQPRYRFSEMVEAYLPAAASSPAGDSNGSGIDRFVVGVAGDYLKQPYLQSQVPGYLKDTGLENLKVLTCGEQSYDLCDQHYSGPFGMAVERLAKRFDVVLIDSPPVAFDSATASLAPAVDGVVLVVKSNELNVGVIQQAKEHLVRSGADVLGVVLNQVDLFKDEALPYYRSVYR